MSQHLYILADEYSTAYAKILSGRLSANRIFISNNRELTADILVEMAKTSKTSFFYVIATEHNYDLSKFDFSFKPPTWDIDYMHTWGNNTIRLFNKANVLSNPSEYTDDALSKGLIRIKDLSNYKYSIPVYDVVMLSYDEFDADEKYDKLKTRVPKAQHVSGVKGIVQAHIRAAKVTTSDMIFVVDADADILPTFDFSYVPTVYDIDLVHIWHSRNPVNGLEYGYGGVKLFPRASILAYKGSPVDFTTSVARGVKIMPEVSNITQFDTDPFSAWRSGFREATKLVNQDDIESKSRLQVWCNVGTGEFGEFVTAGAIAGAEYGRLYKNQPELLRLINDFDWLEAKFSDQQ